MKGCIIMNEKLKAIIAKVRDMYKYDATYRNTLKGRASVAMTETSDGELVVDTIEFYGNTNWDEIIVTKNCIEYHPYEGKRNTVLMTFKDFDELLAM